MKRLLFVIVLLGAGRMMAQEVDRILSIDHYVGVTSQAPGLSGQVAQIYVRERVSAGTLGRNAAYADRVALFIHGAGTPSEVAFDVPHQDYSWMAFLAKSGFDTFAMDTQGYGRSTRPSAMNDPCNLSAGQQTAIGKAPCPTRKPQESVSLSSDWNDIGAVVDYVRALRHVDKIALFGWSLGGPRAGYYAGQHPEKVSNLILLAPAYNRSTPGVAPASGNSAMFGTQSKDEFLANWDRQVGCPDQYDAATSESIWSQMLESDPIGATWGTGVRRAPNVSTWGWNGEVAARTQIPALLISGVHDKQVSPERVKELYADLASKQKVFIDLACSSHNAMWEKNHLLLFRASLEWLTKGTVNGNKEGMLRLGY